MDKSTYEAMNQQEINGAIERLIPNGSGTISEPRLRQALDVLAQRIANNTRAYELLGIRTADEMAQEWGVSRRRAQAFIANLHNRWSVGRKIGGVWCLSAEEALTHRPAAAGRPRLTPDKALLSIEESAEDVQNGQGTNFQSHEGADHETAWSH